jgi:hypothetical protein
MKAPWLKQQLEETKDGNSVREHGASSGAAQLDLCPLFTRWNILQWMDASVTVSYWVERVFNTGRAIATFATLRESELD